jgi:hypothetical protein
MEESMKEKTKILENIKLFFQGAFNHRAMSVTKIEEALVDEIDEFLFICFSENLGIELPTNYYTLELLPYLGDELEIWEEKMVDRKNMWEEKVTECPL